MNQPSEVNVTPGFEFRQSCRRHQSYDFDFFDLVHVYGRSCWACTFASSAAHALRDIAGRIATDLGRDVPWHITRYYPAYQFTAPPMPLGTLEHAWQIGKQAGLDFVYMGNLPGDPHDDTYCPGCGERLIHRHVRVAGKLEQNLSDHQCYSLRQVCLHVQQ